MAAKRPAKKSATPSTPSATKRGTSRPATRRRAARPAVDAASDQLPAGGLIDEVRTGGETHQTAGDGQPRLTTQQGVPVGDDQNTLKVGPRGPSLLEDFHFREKIFHFDHERIPERVVHARGFGVHGYFEPYESLADVTRADLFQRPGERTPVFVRFSTVAGNKGSFDLARDVRGFAVKFYTQEGNWDLVGNNIPVFFIQDAIKFPDVVHSVKQAPDRGFPQAQSAHDNFWDFISLMPEATHMVMWTMSDRAIPRSFRFMEGFGVHSFRFVNAAGESTFVKFHWKPKLGLQSVLWNEAVKINGADPDFHRRDLWDAINGGDFPEWELGVQLFDDDFADQFDFDVLDATKIIPEELVPVRRVGRLVLDRTGRQLLRRDRAGCVLHPERGPRHRLHQRSAAAGTQLLLSRHPTEAPRRTQLHAPAGQRAEVSSGPLPAGRPHGDRSTPSVASTTSRTRGQARPEVHGRTLWAGIVSYAEDLQGPKQRVRSDRFADHYSQARQFFISQTPIEQDHIVDAFVFELSKCEQPGIRARMVANLRNVDDGFARRVAEALRLDPYPEASTPARPPITDLPPSPALSIVANGPETFAGRKFGVLVTDGTDAALLEALRKAATAEGALVELIAPWIGGVRTSDGALRPAHQHVAGGPSVLYDAVAILASAEGATAMAADPAAKDFVTDAHAHGKFIAYDPAAIPLLEAAGVAGDLDDGYIALERRGAVTDFIERCRSVRHWQRSMRTANEATVGAVAD